MDRFYSMSCCCAVCSRKAILYRIAVTSYASTEFTELNLVQKMIPIPLNSITPREPIDSVNRMHPYR